MSGSGLRLISAEKMLVPPTPIDFIIEGAFAVFLEVFLVPFSGRVSGFF
jgi:hypothetical protein